jgi:hypothetical protein
VAAARIPHERLGRTDFKRHRDGSAHCTAPRTDPIHSLDHSADPLQRRGRLPLLTPSISDLAAARVDGESSPCRITEVSGPSPPSLHWCTPPLVVSREALSAGPPIGESHHRSRPSAGVGAMELGTAAHSLGCGPLPGGSLGHRLSPVDNRPAAEPYRAMVPPIMCRANAFGGGGSRFATVDRHGRQLPGGLDFLTVENV